MHLDVLEEPVGQIFDVIVLVDQDSDPSSLPDSYVQDYEHLEAFRVILGDMAIS